MKTEKKKTEKKQVVKTNVYHVELTFYEDGTTSLRRYNNGFNLFELLGILDLTRVEIVEQMRGNLKPDVIKREVVNQHP